MTATAEELREQLGLPYDPEALVLELADLFDLEVTSPNPEHNPSRLGPLGSRCFRALYRTIQGRREAAADGEGLLPSDPRCFVFEFIEDRDRRIRGTKLKEFGRKTLALLVNLIETRAKNLPLGTHLPQEVKQWCLERVQKG